MERPAHVEIPADRKGEASFAPFIVRGHHTLKLYNLLAMGMTIEEVLEMAREKSPSKAYERDVYGNTDSETQLALNGIKAFFEEFMGLPDDAPVQVSAGVKDGICNACIIGDHCTSTSGDTPYLRAIRKIAKNQGIEHDLVESRVTVEGSAKPLPSLNLSAQSIRQILSDPEFHPQAVPAFMRAGARLSVSRSIKKLKRQRNSSS